MACGHRRGVLRVDLIGDQRDGQRNQTCTKPTAATWNVHQIAVIVFRKEYDEHIVNVWLQVLRR